jgi:hypothetical protein
MDLEDELSSVVRTAAACLRATTNGGNRRDAAYLHEVALEALERGEAALDASLEQFRLQQEGR